jgi:hypothetical protein
LRKAEVPLQARVKRTEHANSPTILNKLCALTGMQTRVVRGLEFHSTKT